MNEIARKRAESRNDNREWTPQDAIEDASNRIKNIDPKKVHLMIVWREDQSDETSKLGWNAANLQRHDQIALLELLKFDLCKDWFGYGE